MWHKVLRAALPAALALLVPASASAGPERSGFGAAVTSADLREAYSVAPYGAGLPSGSGTAAEGRKVYASMCASCHGDHLQGIKATGAPALVGGRGSLTDKKPLKTVESYWPYATTLFDYVRRAMPFNAPGSLANDDVYAVVAYILVEDHILAPETRLDARTLPAVPMPNARGFIPDPRPK